MKFIILDIHLNLPIHLYNITVFLEENGFLIRHLIFVIISRYVSTSLNSTNSITKQFNIFSMHFNTIWMDVIKTDSIISISKHLYFNDSFVSNT